MSKELHSFEHIPWEIIKSYLANSDSVELSEEHRNMLDRVFSLQRILQRYPQMRTAIAIHRSKFPEINKTTAYNDHLMARKLENTYHTFDYEFYNNWLINDTLDAIQAARSKGDIKNWIAGLAVLKKVIGERPVQETDPKLIEKHTFLIQINNMKEGVRIDIDQLDKIPMAVRKDIADAVWEEIDEEQAGKMMNS